MLTLLMLGRAKWFSPNARPVEVLNLLGMWRWPLASSPSDEEKLVRQPGGEKQLRMETLSIWMDSRLRHIAPCVDRFEHLRCPFREGA